MSSTNDLLVFQRLVLSKNWRNLTQQSGWAAGFVQKSANGIADTDGDDLVVDVLPRRGDAHDAANQRASIDGQWMHGILAEDQRVQRIAIVAIRSEQP